MAIESDQRASDAPAGPTGGVDYESVPADYLAARQLKKGAAGWVLLAGLGVSYVISDQVVDTAIQLHGALGYSHDTPLARWYTGIRSQRLVDGPDEVHRWRAGANVIKAFEKHGSTASACGGELFEEGLLTDCAVAWRAGLLSPTKRGRDALAPSAVRG